MKACVLRRGLLDVARSYWQWKKSNAAAAAGKMTAHNDVSATLQNSPGAGQKSTSPSFLSSSLSFDTPLKFLATSSSTPLDTLQHVVHRRSSCRRFDTTRPVDLDLIADLLATAVRTPTAFNLQPWVAVVVHDAVQRATLSVAALGQHQPRDAPVTIVFAGDMEPERRAPAVLEMGLNSGYYHPLYGAAFLRHVYYHLHGGPLSCMAHVKSMFSSWYSESTGTALLSVPTNMQGYAWKQTMIPATTFVYLATAAGLDTAILEGFDEAQVRAVAGLPPRYTVPVIVSVGYGAAVDKCQNVRSPRFPTSHLVRWGKF